MIKFISEKLSFQFRKDFRNIVKTLKEEELNIDLYIML